MALDPPTTAAEASSTRDRPHDSSQEKVAFEKIELKPAAETSEKAESTAVLHDLHHQQGYITLKSCYNHLSLEHYQLKLMP